MSLKAIGKLLTASTLILLSAQSAPVDAQESADKRFSTLIANAPSFGSTVIPADDQSDSSQTKNSNELKNSKKTDNTNQIKGSGNTNQIKGSGNTNQSRGSDNTNQNNDKGTGGGTSPSSGINGQTPSLSAISSFFNPTLTSLTSNLTNAATASQTSLFGLKQVFYQLAPHAMKEALGPAHSNQTGSDAVMRYETPPLPGTEPSGLAPHLTEQPGMPHAQQYLPGQPVPHPWMQRELTVDSNPLLTHWGPPLPGEQTFWHILPTNLSPQGINSLTYTDMPHLTGASFPSDLTSHMSALSVSQKTGQKLLDPNLPSIQAQYQGGAQQTADAAQQDVEAAFKANLGCTSSPLINVANENAASKATAGQEHRTLEQAIWIVQQMYRMFFLPVSLMLLLVGTAASQSSNIVRFSFLDTSELSFNSAKPFEGILRSVVALFMICSIQLLVSYSIDIGNALTDPIKNMVDNATLVNWSQNFVNPTGQLNAAQMQQFSESETTAAATGRVIFGTVQALLNTGLMVLTAYQIVMVCYLYLFGPIAAALYAWPAIGTRFRSVFKNWVNGLSNLVLWRFWWCIILLCMATRVRWLQDIGAYNPNSPWEPLVYTAFLVMLTYVPFAALDFRPGDMVQSLLDKATPKQGA